MQLPGSDPDKTGSGLVMDIKERPGYLHVTVIGRNSVANVMKYLSDIHDPCMRRNCPVVLIEENLQGPGLGIGSIHNIISQASKNTQPVVTRIAYVDTNKEHKPGRMEFAETVAFNRGVNVRVFSDVDEARRWLESTTTRT